MNKQGTHNPAQGNKADNAHSLSLFPIFGIEIRLDISVIIIFTLIVFSLGNGVYTSWHPEWAPAMVWGTALLSGLAFLRHCWRMNFPTPWCPSTWVYRYHVSHYFFSVVSPKLVASLIVPSMNS